MKPLRQDVKQEAPDELVGAESHCAVPSLPVAAVILVPEGHAALVESNKATVRDRAGSRSALRAASQSSAAAP